MSIDNSVESWLARDDQEDTVVEGPIVIEPQKADEDLKRYHPTEYTKGACRFRLVAGENENEAIVLVSDERNWNPDFLRVLRSLVFRGTWKDGFQFLKADPIPVEQSVLFREAEWRVVDWRIVRTRFDAEHVKLEELTEVIKWRDKSGNEGMSTYGWRVYLPKSDTGSPELLSAHLWSPA